MLKPPAYFAQLIAAFLIGFGAVMDAAWADVVKGNLHPILTAVCAGAFSAFMYAVRPHETHSADEVRVAATSILHGVEQAVPQIAEITANPIYGPTVVHLSDEAIGKLATALGAPSPQALQQATVQYSSVPFQVVAPPLDAPLAPPSVAAYVHGSAAEPPVPAPDKLLQVPPTK